jgi:hypothetical protein
MRIIFKATLLCVAMIALLAGECHAAGAGILASFDIPSDGQVITLPVVLTDGKEYQFLLDTGSAYNTFDKSLESMLGKPRQSIKTLGNDGKMHVVHVYYAPDAKLGALSLHQGGAVLCVDLTELREVTGLDIMGVIGMGFLRRYVLQIDAPGGKLRLMRSGKMAKTPKDWGQALPMPRAVQGSPLVLGRLYGKYEAPFLIDTGYVGTAGLSGKLFDRLDQEKLFTALARKPVARLGGKGFGSLARVDKFALGKWSYSGLIFNRAAEGNMLGMGFVRRQKLTMDFPNLQAYLEAPRAITDQSDMSGLHLLMKNSADVVVHSVDKNSQAYQAGLKAGDILNQVNSRPISELTLFEIRQMLRAGNGQKIEVIFKRGDKFFKTSFTMKKKI